MARKRKISSTEKRRQRLIKKLKNREHWLKWGLGVALILVVLLFLLLGFATDWTRGLRRDSRFTSSSLPDSPDSLTSTAGVEESSDGAGGGTTSTGTTRGSTRNQSSNNSTSEKTTIHTSTNTATTSQPPSELSTLYEMTKIGDDIDKVRDQANQAGVNSICENNLVIQTCTFSQGSSSFTTRNILGTNAITSVTDNF